MKKIGDKIGMLKSTTKTGLIMFDAYLATRGIAIPIGSIMSSVLQTGLSFRDHFLYQKLRLFLDQGTKLTDSQKIAFLKIIDVKPENLYEEILNSIDRLDHIEKSIILGMLFESTVIGLLDLTTYRRLVSVVDKLYIEDLLYFKRGGTTIGKETPLNLSISANLSRFGLYKERLTVDAALGLAGVNANYEISELGIKLWDNGFRSRA